MTRAPFLAEVFLFGSGPTVQTTAPFLSCPTTEICFQPNSTYTFVARFENVEGWSEWSPQLSTSTALGVVPEQPDPMFAGTLPSWASSIVWCPSTVKVGRLRTHTFPEVALGRCSRADHCLCLWPEWVHQLHVPPLSVVADSSSGRSLACRGSRVTYVWPYVVRTSSRILGFASEHGTCHLQASSSVECAGK